MNSAPLSDLTGIASFVYAVELGSFSAAAVRMGMSKSAVAKSVAKLEQRLEMRLLHRTTRRLGLTVEGHSYHETCLRILTELESAESLLASRLQNVSGVLRVSVPPAFGSRWAVPLLLSIVDKYPKLQLDISATDRYVDLVDEGIDLAIRIGDLGDSASLIARKLGHQQSMLCASPAYLAKHGRPVTLEDLQRHICLGETRAGRVLPWNLRDEASQATKVYVKPHHVISSGDGLLVAVLAGAGLVYLPNWLVNPYLQTGEIEAVLSSPPINDRLIHLVWPRTRDLVPKVRSVVDELIASFSPKPPWER